jgi:predicted exporter
VRHRALRPTLAACLPALLAGAGTLGLLSLAGVELNLLALVALLMVIGMGVDYGILLAETGGDSRLRRATQLSVFVAGATTILGFGLLSLSDERVLFLIGATAGLGVLTSLLLVPSIAILTAVRKKS